MTFVHSGVVEFDRRAIVFPGKSRYGKSTMVAALVEAGCRYLSDEYAVISPEGGRFRSRRASVLARKTHPKYNCLRDWLRRKLGWQ